MEEQSRDLPPAWVEVQISEAFKTSTGNTPSKSESRYYGSHIPFVKPPELTGKPISTAEDNLSALGKEKARILLPGSVLVSCIGGLGKIGINKIPVAFNQQINAIEPNYDLAVPEFIFYQAQTYKFKEALENLSSATTISIVNRKKFDSVRIRLAPLNEQKRIVDKIELLFSDLDEGEALLKTVQKQLATYRQSVLKAAVTGELTKDWREQNKHSLEPGDKLLERIIESRRENWKGRGKYKEPEEPKNLIFVDIPNSWSVATIDQISSIVEYGSSAKCSTENLGVPVVRMGNIQNGQLDLGDLKYLPENHDEFPKLLLECGDLLFNRTNSAELVGKTAVYMGKPEKCSFASYLIRVKLIDTVPVFVSAYINSAFGRAWIKSVVSQQVGQANVNGSKLKSLNIPLPSREEQEEIVQRLDNIFSQIYSLENWCATELERSATLRQSILKAAFSGKLVQQDLSDEPASELLKRIQANRAVQPKASNTRLHKKRISKTEVA